MSAHQNAIEALQRSEQFAGEHDVNWKYIEENAVLEEIANYEKRLRVVDASEILVEGEK